MPGSLFDNTVPQTVTGTNPGSVPPTTGPGSPNYPYNPQPLPGQGAFGSVPGPVQLPNPYGDLNASLGGGLPGLNNQLSQDIQNQLGGRLSPETLAAIQNQGAQFGVASGMPGGGLGRNRTLRDLGLTTAQVQQQGIQNYNQTIPTISGTQTVNPAQQIALAQWNATNRAAPDPTQAANYAKQLFDQYLAAMRGPGGGSRGQQGGPAGGTGASAGGGYTGPQGFGVNDFAGGSGSGQGQPLDPLDEVFGTDPGTIGALGDWWNQGPAIQDPVAAGPMDMPIDYAGGNTPYDPLAGFGDLGF